MAALYLTEQGSKLRKTSKRLLVEKGGTILLEVPANEIDSNYNQKFIGDSVVFQTGISDIIVMHPDLVFLLGCLFL
jgi:hypothetical protein